MIGGNLWNEARANIRTALLFMAERSTLVQLAETVGVTLGPPSKTRSDLDERRVGA